MREIKPIPLSHIDEAASIEAACLGSAWSAEQLADSVGRPDFCYIGAFEDGILTAVCSYSLVAGEVQIVNLAVLPAYRRRGAGRKELPARIAARISNSASVRADGIPPSCNPPYIARKTSAWPFHPHPGTGRGRSPIYPR